MAIEIKPRKALMIRKMHQEHPELSAAEIARRTGAHHGYAKAMLNGRTKPGRVDQPPQTGPGERQREPA